MQRRLKFSSRGSSDDIRWGLVRHISRRSLIRGWVERVESEGRRSLVVALGASWIGAWLVLAPTGLSVAVMALIIHAVYLPLTWALWRLTADRRCESAPRVARLEGWLDRMRAVLGPSVAMDLSAELHAPGCQGRQGRCGDPWLVASIFPSEGVVIEVRVTDGRACPLIRVATPAGRVLTELILSGDDPHKMAEVARRLGRFSDPEGVKVRLVELDGLCRLRWVLDQDTSAIGDAILAWPVLRLIAMMAAMDEGRALEAPLLAPTTCEAVPSQRWALGGAARLLGPQRASLPLGRPGDLEAVAGAARGLWRSGPRPSSALLSAGFVVNGSLGVAALAMSGVAGAAPRAGAALVGAGSGGWALVMAMSVVVGLMSLAPLPLEAWRRRQELPRGRRAGALEVGEASVRLQLAEGDPNGAGVDLSRPFTAHLTREAGAGKGVGVTRVFAAVIQRDAAGGLARVGFASTIPSCAEVMALPAKDEVGLPELETSDFLWFWRRLQDSAAAHGAALPRIER